MKSLFHTVCAVSIFIASGHALAVFGLCPNGFAPAELDLALKVSTTVGCPILEDQESYRWVQRYAPGNEFAYTYNIPGTCLFGELDTDPAGTPNPTNTPVPSNTLTIGRQTYNVTYAVSNSAQRYFPEADELGSPFPYEGVDGLFVLGITAGRDAAIGTASGSAITVVSLTVTSTEPNTEVEVLDINLVLADRFTISFDYTAQPVSPGKNTEDFQVLGSPGGDLNVVGQLSGSADATWPPVGFMDEPFSVSGTVCASFK